MSDILVVDDEPAIGWSLRELLTDEGHSVAVAASVEEALASCRGRPPETILLDVRLPGRDGLSAIPDLRALAPRAPVIVMTAFGDLETAVRAVEAGAFDYLVKPFDLTKVSAVVARAVAERTAAAAAPPADEEGPAPRLVGMGPRMQEVFKQIALVATTDLPVLITGGPGTGKELAARAIHAHGSRRGGPFVATSLAALAPAAVEAELFGQARTAPAGAADGRPGLVELAAGGTLFLDEVAAAPIDVQARLLRTLESGEFTRVGSAAPQRADVRVVAATECDLAAAVAAGSFRGDLLERLRVLAIEMPPLAARPEDIEPLARHFLARHAARQPHRAAPAAPTAEFFAALRGRPWPGNARELRHAVEHAAVVARGAALRPEHLPAVPAAAAPTATPLEAAAAAVAVATREWAAAARLAYAELPEPDLHHRAVTVLEAALLREALAHTGGNRTAAARLLGLDRATLRTKLRLLGLDE